MQLPRGVLYCELYEGNDVIAIVFCYLLFSLFSMFIFFVVDGCYFIILIDALVLLLIVVAKVLSS